MITLSKTKVTAFIKFITERELIRIRKEAGEPQHTWTKDLILGRFRFCNVFREDDRVTRWIAKNWRAPLAGHANMFFAMSVARLVNWPGTLSLMDPLMIASKWHPRLLVKAVAHQRAHGRKAWGGAYIVSTNGQSMDKAEYVACKVLGPLWEQRTHLSPVLGDTLENFSEHLQEHNGFKGFMAGQVIADMKYDSKGPLFHAEDWDTWAVSGPGSRRGLNRMCDRDLRAPWKEREWMELVRKLRQQVNSRSSIGALHAQDIQNCLCEFDKYERVRLGQGQPRALYRSHGEEQ